MMASLTSLDLAALLCSRVCHDVISPVGAIVNGLEVLEGEAGRRDARCGDGAHQEERDLSLRPPSILPPGFRRRGFIRGDDRHGRRGKGGEGHFRQWPHGPGVGRRNGGWRRETPSSSCSTFASSRPSAIPRGGVVTVDIVGRKRRHVDSDRSQGSNARLSHSAADILTGAFPEEAIDGHSIQLYFTTLLARECQATLSARSTVSASPETVTLIARTAAAPIRALRWTA